MVVLLVKNAETEKHDLSSVRAGMTGAAPLTEEWVLFDSIALALADRSRFLRTSVALRKKFPKWTFGQGAFSLASRILTACSYFLRRLRNDRNVHQ